MRSRSRVHLGILVASCLVAVISLLGCAGSDGSQGDGQEPPADGSSQAVEEQDDAADGQADDAEEAGALPEEGPSIPPLHPGIDDLPETVVTITTDEGSEVRIDAKVAATTEHRRRGLMEVPDLPEGTGMLFLFEEERTGGFWMWDTLVPLDIAYVAADGTIVEILAMDPCEEDESSACPSYPPDEAYVAAIEVPQDWFAWQGVVPGNHASWPDPAS